MTLFSVGIIIYKQSDGIPTISIIKLYSVFMLLTKDETAGEIFFSICMGISETIRNTH